MFKKLFTIIINLMATIIQIIALPINSYITTYLPDISTKLTQVSTTITGMFNGLNWALGLVPDSVVEVLLFIVTVEIAKRTIYVSTHVLLKVWEVFQKIKFW